MPGQEDSKCRNSDVRTDLPGLRRNRIPSKVGTEGSEMTGDESQQRATF